MAISKDKTRIAVIVSNETQEKIKKMADKESRSISNMASILITEAIETREGQD